MMMIMMMLATHSLTHSQPRQVLIEKLLYSCPGVERIYLLIRGAKGKSPQDRLNEMIGQRPFTMRLKQDFIKQKLVAIESDLADKRLALSDEHLCELARNVAIIFHVAASVKFEAPLEVNMRHNVMATRELFEIACDFEKLQCFVHVSTAYSNCQLRQIDERVYQMDVPSDLAGAVVTKSMIDNRPNTYTYTKAMAENVASKYASRMNVVIVRPSIVMSALAEPAQGWVDTINGPVGLSVLGALGILQKIKVNSEVVFDLIPVDIVTNALVSIAWAATEKRGEFLPGSSPSLADNITTSTTTASSTAEAVAFTTKTATTAAAAKTEDLNNNSGGKSAAVAALSLIGCKKAKPSGGAGAGRPSSHGAAGATSVGAAAAAANMDGTVRVFNLTTGEENPCSFYQYFSIGRDEAYNKPSSRALRPILHIPKQKGTNKVQYWIHKIFSHLLFAHIVDFILTTLGQKRLVVKAVNRMHHANEVFDYFCSNQWSFVTDNVKRLRDLQSDHDRATFNCDVRAIDWEIYARIGWLGCRRFILKEEDETIESAKRRYRSICLFYYVAKLALLVVSTGIARYLISSGTVLSMLLLPIYGVVYLL